ncbi:hypothetical protein MJO47_10065 [Desulfuromonas sp. KJ2020]|uniref:hypothetical protein n=1 Tax=Desulfuromonas sp. KJ2020 TaxID=2919173 RepID=UPI0020A71E97|nr:hypothetical protein [Desulfuromonas sp. KJ2020]MCP3177444.1 hypothetical protein [Desulfuromonas sp. KJ2020]
MMSRWNEQYETHAFKKTWSTLHDVLSSEDLEKNNSEQAVKEIARLFKVVSYIDSILEQIDPELMPASFLNGANQHATNCLNELNAFKGNQNPGHLQNSNNHADQLIVIFSQTPFNLTAQQKGALSKSATVYASVLDEHLKNLKENTDTRIDEVSKGIEKLKLGTNAVSVNLNDLQAQLKTVSQTIEKQTAEFNTQFQSGEQGRNTKFEAVSLKLQEKADKEFEKLAEKVAVSLDVLGKYLDDASKVFGVVVNTLQAGSYSLYANEEKKTADWLRRFAFLFMIAGVVILLAPEVARMFKDFSDYTFDWKNIAGRSFFSLILFIPGFYLARESTSHRSNEILNRRRELILSTIDPYLALLDKVKAEQIKTELAKNIFSEGNVALEDNSLDASNLFAQFSNLVKLISKSGK